MISALSAGRTEEAVAVDYHVDGEQTACAVARGDSTLVEVAIAGHDFRENYLTDAVDTVIRSLGNRPRIYADAIFARTLERTYGLPSSDCFDDVGVMVRLLDVAGLSGQAADPLPFSPQDEYTPSQVISLFRELPGRLRAAGLDYVYAGVELPVIDSVVSMTINGVPVDTAVLDHIEASTSADLDILRHRFAELTGGGVNLNDDNSIREYFYDRCRLPVPFLTPAGFRSICDDALNLLVDHHPAVALVQSYRTQRHALTTCRDIRRNYCELTGCVHGLLNPLGADTGRFSCKNPNLHGVPHLVRPAVRARAGMMLVEGDISQTEYRVLAHFTRDPGLINAFQAGDADLHKQTMALVLGKPLEKVTTAERKVGKAVNFGTCYGETEHGLSRKLGISIEAARGFIDGFFRARPAVYDWIEMVKQQVHRDGYVQTLSGRRRSLPAIWFSNPAAIAEAERQAVNTIIQGSAADLMKQMLARLHCTLPDG